MSKLLIFGELNDLFLTKGVEIGLVGGAVRDLLLGILFSVVIFMFSILLIFVVITTIKMLYNEFWK